MNPGELPHPLTIQRKASSTAEDEFGQQRVDWENMPGDLGWDWGRVQEISSVTYPIASHWVEKASHVIRMRWREDLALDCTKYQIVFENRTMALLGSTNPDGVRREILIGATEIKNPLE